MYPLRVTYEPVCVCEHRDGRGAVDCVSVFLYLPLPPPQCPPPQSRPLVSLPSAGEIRIAFVLYKHIGAYLSTENASVKLGHEAMATNHSVIVNSPVITAAINKDANKVYLSDPVIFTMRHLQVTPLSLAHVHVHVRIQRHTL